VFGVVTIDHELVTLNKLKNLHFVSKQILCQEHFKAFLGAGSQEI